MAEKKVSAPSGGAQKAVGAEYSVQELAAAASTIFPGVSPDCVTAALRMAKVEKVTKAKAKKIVDAFVSTPVAGPKKGGK